MSITEIIVQLDHEIAQLQQARVLLAGGKPSPKRNVADPPVKKKRKLTPEGRKRIAEAVKRRWAAQKKATAK